MRNVLCDILLFYVRCFTLQISANVVGNSLQKDFLHTLLSIHYILH